MAIDHPLGERREVSAEKTVATLNKYLRGELSACETYRQAIDKLKDEPHLVATLEDCLRSHEQRVGLLRDHVVSRGGEPSEGSGPWGAFAKLVEGGAKLFGKDSAIAALEEGEDHGNRLYRGDDDLDATARTLLETELRPAQERTHATLSSLKHTRH